KRLPVRFDLHREFRYDCATPAADFLGERAIFGRIQLRQSRPNDRDRAPFCCQRALMRGRIDSARQTANHSQPRVSKLVGELFRALTTVVSGATRADDPDRVLIALMNCAPTV